MPHLSFTAFLPKGTVPIFPMRKQRRRVKGPITHQWQGWNLIPSVPDARAWLFRVFSKPQTLSVTQKSFLTEVFKPFSSMVPWGLPWRLKGRPRTFLASIR